MSRRFLLILIACALLPLAGCTRSSPRAVAAIARTRSYHREECRRVFMARTVVMTAHEAVARHYAPCPICKPDTEG